MHADKRRLRTKKLSASICVYLRLISNSQTPVKALTPRSNWYPAQDSNLDQTVSKTAAYAGFRQRGTKPGGLGWIRTITPPLLRRLPLPIGLQGLRSLTLAASRGGGFGRICTFIVMIKSHPFCC